MHYFLSDWQGQNNLQWTFISEKVSNYYVLFCKQKRSLLLNNEAFEEWKK